MEISLDEAFHGKQAEIEIEVAQGCEPCGGSGATPGTGTKRCTIRFRDPVQVGPALLVFELPEPVSLPGRVTSTVATRVSDITEEDARADGFASAGEVLPGLREHYPDLCADDEVVLVRFALDG